MCCVYSPGRARCVTYFTVVNLNGEPVTGAELKKLRQHLGEAIGQPLSVADMAKLCGLPPSDGADTIRKWEVTGPTGPVAELLRILAMASDHYPILEMFNVFDRHDVAGEGSPRAPAGLPRTDAQRRAAPHWLSKACRRGPGRAEN